MYKVDKPNLIEFENDHFNLYPKVEGMTSFLENIHSKEVLKHNNLVALYGEWGSGKSSVVTTVNEKLNKEKFNSFIFEAWKYEKDDNLSFSIFEAIMDNIIKDKDAMKKILKEEFSRGLKSFTNGVTVKIPFVEMSLKDMEPSKIEESLYTKIENFIDKFKELLKTYSNNKTTVIFIDDLDRCEDESIINLLVALKLMFTLENIIFVCCIDKVATVEALKRKYNNQEKSESFLDKLFLFDFNIIPIEGDKFINMDNESESRILLEIFREFNIKNPRKIKKIVNKIIMLCEFIKNDFSNEKEKGLYFTTLYYLLTLKEINYILFNKFLNLRFSNFYIKKGEITGGSRRKRRYYFPNLINLAFNNKEENTILNKEVDKIVYLFSDLFYEDNFNDEKDILEGIPLKKAIELLKKYS